MTVKAYLRAKQDLLEELAIFQHAVLTHSNELPATRTDRKATLLAERVRAMELELQLSKGGTL